MEILGLSTSPSSGGAYALILSETEGNRRLPIIIGTFEAQAIALELEHIKPPRPMTHDLLRNVIQSFDSFVKSIVISDLKEGTFYAKVICDLNGQEIELDARPSDAIALGIRFKAPIFASDEVLNEAGITSATDVVDSLRKSGKSVAYDETAQTSSVKGADAAEISFADKLKQLEKKLDTAIKNENYEEAAQLRDQISRIKG
ncbi:MAG: bifunctional nuclease family protein [Balneolales bacterium]|nr:bifunctional nuclease family protein [Balneolales bacterium]